MDPARLLALISTLSCVGLMLAIALRREPSLVASTALALLAALLLWSGGIGVALATDPGPWHVAARRTAVLGMLAAPSLWLLLALRRRWPRRLGGAGATAVALTPAFVFTAAALAGARGMASAWWPMGWPKPSGPTELLMYTLFALSFACGVAGTSLFTLSARELWQQGERRAGVVLALVMLAQPFTLIAALRPVGGPTPLAAGSLTLATLVLAITALRYQLLQPPPLGHRQVIDRLREGILMASANGEILDCNAAAERMLDGDPRRYAIGYAIAELAPEENRRSIRTALARAEQGPEPVSLRFVSARDRHIEVSVRPIVGDEERVLGQIAMLRDRTDERRYAESALRTQKLETVGTLAAGIAHEVNNPLAFVHANLGEIARMAEVVEAWQSKREQRARPGRAPVSNLAEELVELGELARDSIEGLSRIQRAVSDVRRLAAAPTSGHGPVSLQSVIEDAVRLLELRGDGRVEVEARVDPDTPEVQGSAQLLVQALLSLLLDCQQALEGVAGPRIEIETGFEPESVWVRIRDNGPPVPEELRERIFEPCFAAPSHPSRRGRGLGLSVATGIARDHGGSLIAEPCASGGAFLLRLGRVE